MTKKPTCYMLVGLPAAGKSTWIATQPFDWNRTVVASTDNYIERAASAQGKTYSDVFKTEFAAATSNMNATVADAIKNNFDIVWDQTNTTPDSRKKKLKVLPNNYRKVAVIFNPPPKEEHERRLASRPGKIIPADAVERMASQYVMPTRAEGFDEIWVA